MNINRGRYPLVFVLLAGSGCGGSRIPQNEDIQRQAALLSFRNCSELKGYLDDIAVKNMRSVLEQEKRGGIGWPAVFSGGPQAAGDARNSSVSAPTAFTQTNTQVAGVDEADIVKTDGTRIFTLSGGNALYIVQSWPASQLSTAGKVSIEGWARDLFLVGDASQPSAPASTAVVFSEIYSDYPLGTSGAASAAPCRYAPSGAACIGSAPTTKVTLLDVRDAVHPGVLGAYYLPGYYDTSRRIASSVRVVSNDLFQYPEAVKWYPDGPPDIYSDPAKLGAALDRLMDQNEGAIRSASIDRYLHDAQHVFPDGTTQTLPNQCTDFSRTNGPTQLGFVTVWTIDVTANSLARSTVVANASVVYASARALYVATEHWWWWPQPGQKGFTYLHKFDIGQPDQALYLGSGGVEGLVADQFSLDEDTRGNLRAATTLYHRVADSQNWWGRLETSNRISVLAPHGSSFDLVGQSDDFLPGERMYGTRFVGDKGYVVTFHQVDPLSIFDLRDPSHPQKVGELQVPGFSTYLQPLDDNHLLAIGEYLPADSHWSGRSIQLSLFDVSSPSHPVQAFNQLVGSSSAYSEAQYDHRAFTWFAEKRLLAIPFFDWNASMVGPEYWRNFVSGVRVFGVDSSQGFSDKGMLSMRDVYQTVSYNTWSWRWAPMARRGLMASSSSEVFVYAISDAGIRAANLDTLNTPLATVLFDPPSH